MDEIVQLVVSDRYRQKILECVWQLNLPQGYVAAGFVRNLVWDHLHHKVTPTSLNDVDVIYFDTNELESDKYLLFEAELIAKMPNVNWQVRNQAYMHSRNGDEPYQSCLDAMSFWPEKETAVAIRKIGSHRYECISAYGFDSLFEGKITYNPKRPYDLFRFRVESKGWLKQWPNLVVIADSEE
ncbi:nitrate reductase [Photobacterium sanctipauli]|uniref:Nitrate reductase n=1 Tax=Photobacterium sanctipauli TaxID=1342794 RepID=A0A2T3NZM4_9GAMM|nr:nucleotidyltransferase family protein [Photobacterium sanctipauli]PSW21700.1 nitrate reductase [Photobacterium sanctipauli]